VHEDPGSEGEVVVFVDGEVEDVRRLTERLRSTGSAAPGGGDTATRPAGAAAARARIRSRAGPVRSASDSDISG
jgi:hypothetical protein